MWYITKDGDLYGCGDGSWGQQGSGAEDKVLTFTKRAENVKQVVCSEQTTWYLTNDGNLYGCGTCYSGVQGDGKNNINDKVTSFTLRATNVSYVACSHYTTWYITNDEDLYGCGSGSDGQQGNGSNSDYVTTFTKRAENVSFITCSADTTWYITKSGELYGCGDGEMVIRELEKHL